MELGGANCRLLSKAGMANGGEFQLGTDLSVSFITRLRGGTLATSLLRPIHVTPDDGRTILVPTNTNAEFCHPTE